MIRSQNLMTSKITNTLVFADLCISYLQKKTCVSRCSRGEYAELYILQRTICRGMDSCFNMRDQATNCQNSLRLSNTNFNQTEKLHVNIR